MKKHRFVPKCFGRGFVPVSWEGRLMTLVLILLSLGSVYVHGFFGEPEVVSPVAVVGFLLDLVVLIVLFCLIAIPKTKGVVKWHRGRTSK